MIRGGRQGEAAAAQGSVAFPFAAAGFVFTAWFNGRLRRLDGPTVWVGTTLARVIELHADGLLEVETETEALEPERQFVPLTASDLDRLLPGFAGQGAGHEPGP